MAFGIMSPSPGHIRISVWISTLMEFWTVSGTLSPGTMPDKPLLHLGCGAEDFPSPSFFSGFMEGVELFDVVLEADEIRRQAAKSGSPLVDVWVLRGEIEGASWVKDSSGEVSLHLPESDREQVAELRVWHGPRSSLLQAVLELENSTVGQPGFSDRRTGPSARDADQFMDAIRCPWIFFPLRNGLVVTTWSGEVWLGRSDAEDESRLRWTRIASGLNQPLGIAVRNGEILVHWSRSSHSTGGSRW